MEQTLNDAGTVVVTAIIPMTMKGDTTEFSADAFGTKPNAVVEDLLKKLPGVEVDKNGAITAQGQQVTQVFVDGKRFFSNDPKLATQNLPSDVVDKIQVFDGKSDQSEFTGFDDGNAIKTINIVTKRNMRHGWFGKSSAGIGNDDATLKDPLYAVTARIFRFDGDEKMALVGQVNNINQQGFTPDQSSSNGITKTISPNLNFSDVWGKTDFSGSYRLRDTKNNTLDNQYRQNLYGNDTLQNNRVFDTSNSSNVSHNFNFNFDTKFDSSNELRVRPSVSLTNNSSSRTSNTEIDSIYKNDTTQMSRTGALTSSKQNGYNANVSATYRHKFDKKGRTISLDMQFANSHNDGSGANQSDVFTYLNQRDSFTNQVYNTISKSTSLSSTLSYTEPINDKQLLQLEWNNSFSTNTSDRVTRNWDSVTHEATDTVAGLTNSYANKYFSNHVTLGYLYNTDRLNFNISAGVQFGSNRSDNDSKDVHISRNYVNLYPTANLEYHISKQKLLRFNYRGRTTQPSVTQLQPIVDNSNPLYITAGNPDLKQTFDNNFLLRYQGSNTEGSKSLSAVITADISSNNIVNSITRLSNGGQYSQPVNVSGFYSFSGYVNWSLPILKPASTLNFISRINNQRSVSLLQSDKNYTYTTSFSEKILWTTKVKENFDVDFYTQPGYNITSYSISKGNNIGNYYSQSISFDGTWYDKVGWEIASDFDYTFYAGQAQGQNVSIPLLDASVAKQIFKNHSGEIKLSVHDILNQNKGVTFTRTDNYLQQSQTNILRRYLLLTFTYNLRSFPGGSRRGSHGDRPWMNGNGDGGFPGGRDGGGFGGGRGGGGRGGF